MAFEIKTSKKAPDIFVLEISGSVERSNSGQLRRELHQFLAKHQPLGVILNFSRFESIDRTGIQVLIEIDKRCQGRLFIVRPSILVSERLKMVEHGHLRIGKSPEETMRSLEEEVLATKTGYLAKFLICNTPGEREHTGSLSYTKIRQLALFAAELFEKRPQQSKKM